MPEPLHLSNAAWALLEMLQHHMEVSFEVLHVSLQPLRQAASAELASAIEQPGVAEEVVKALKTGEVRLDTSRELVIGIFPLRRAREIVGCLLVYRQRAMPAPSVESRALPSAAHDVAADARLIEGAGQLARTALESDLVLNAQLTQTQARTRRLHGILRFLGQLGQNVAEPEMMQAVLQAATVWFDLDCRIYRRQEDDSYVLAATLPGAEPSPGGLRLEPGRAEQLISGRRFSSGDLEDLGLAGRREEVLVVPVGAPAPRWLMLLVGGLEPEAELTFAAIARVLAGELQARESIPEIAAFERRIEEEVERAKRFNLGLGLVLVSVGARAPAESALALDTLSTVLRPELRASDLLGRIRGDVVAMLLVHSGAEGAESVTARLRQRLTALPEGIHVTSVQLGKAVFSADCASAEELISHALDHTQDLPLRN